MNLNNKLIWITGASSGIGEALAIECANKGAVLILSARNESKLVQVKQQLTNSARHIVVPLDLAKSDEIKAIVEPVIAQYGAIDILINNSGISQKGLARDTLTSVQRQVMEVNYFGTISMTQAILPSMIAAQKGMIASIASVAGLVGGKSMSGYSASKHAVIGYMDCLRAEESCNGIQVLNICPGFVQTQISVNALKADGEKYQHMANSIKNGIPVAQCAEEIVKAIEREKAQVIIGKGLSYWAPTIYRFFPKIFRKISAAKNFRE